MEKRAIYINIHENMYIERKHRCEIIKYSFVIKGISKINSSNVYDIQKKRYHIAYSLGFSVIKKIHSSRYIFYSLIIFIVFQFILFMPFSSKSFSWVFQQVVELVDALVLHHYLQQ